MSIHLMQFKNFSPVNWQLFGIHANGVGLLLLVMLETVSLDIAAAAELATRSA